MKAKIIHRLVISSMCRAAVVMALITCQAVAAQEVWVLPYSKDGPCEYHPIPTDSRALVTTIPRSSQNLKSDGRGAYWEGADTVRSYLGVRGAGYNFYTYWPETCEQPLPQKVRSLELHLDSPEGGAKPMGVVSDQMAMLHVFPGKGIRMADMATGQTVSSRRVLLRFHRDGKIYFLRMGTEPFEPALPGGHMEILPGHGTSTANITRESENKWAISAPAGGLARLSIWGPEPVDLGLYQFSFEIQIRVQRPVRRFEELSPEEQAKRRRNKTPQPK